MKPLAIILVMLAATVVLSGQEPIGDLFGHKPAGKVRSVTAQRTYIIKNRRQVAPVVQKLSVDLYDEAGKLTRSSTFGNGERRVLFEYSRAEVKTRVFFFDLAGNPIVEKAFDFIPPTDELGQNDLCIEFSTRIDNDVAGKVSYETETCIDGTVRSTTRIERGEHDYVYRIFIKDAKDRTNDTRYEYDGAGNVKKFTYTVNNLRKPEYWVDVRFVDTRSDGYKNWIRTIGTALSSSSPNEPTYQYIDEQLITYYE